MNKHNALFSLKLLWKFVRFPFDIIASALSTPWFLCAWLSKRTTPQSPPENAENIIKRLQKKFTKQNSKEYINAILAEFKRSVKNIRFLLEAMGIAALFGIIAIENLKANFGSTTWKAFTDAGFNLLNWLGIPINPIQSQIYATHIIIASLYIIGKSSKSKQPLDFKESINETFDSWVVIGLLLTTLAGILLIKDTVADSPSNETIIVYSGALSILFIIVTHLMGWVMFIHILYFKLWGCMVFHRGWFIALNYYLQSTPIILNALHLLLPLALFCTFYGVERFASTTEQNLHALTIIGVPLFIFTPLAFQWIFMCTEILKSTLLTCRIIIFTLIVFLVDVAAKNWIEPVVAFQIS